MAPSGPEKRTGTLNVTGIAIIGKQNNPLYLKKFNDNYPDLKYHYIAHISCDVIEERVNSGSKLSEMYLGMLYAMEDLAVYGYMTNTRIKFVVVLAMTEAVVKDADMKNLFRRIHANYIALVSNPFYNLDGTAPITSPQFIKSIDILAGTS